MKNNTLIMGLVAVALTAGLVYGYSYFAGKGWSAATK